MGGVVCFLGMFRFDLEGSGLDFEVVFLLYLSVLWFTGWVLFGLG